MDNKSINKNYDKLQKMINKDKKKICSKNSKFTMLGSCVIGILGCVVALFLEFNGSYKRNDIFSFVIPPMIALIIMEIILLIWAKYTKYLTNSNEIKKGATIGIFGYILISFIYMFVKYFSEGGFVTSVIFAFSFSTIPYFIPIIIYLLKFKIRGIAGGENDKYYSVNNINEKKPSFNYGVSYVKDKFGNVIGKTTTTSYSDEYGSMERTEYKDKFGNVKAKEDKYRNR